MLAPLFFTHLLSPGGCRLSSDASFWARLRFLRFPLLWALNSSPCRHSAAFYRGPLKLCGPQQRGPRVAPLRSESSRKILNSYLLHKFTFIWKKGKTKFRWKKQIHVPIHRLIFALPVSVQFGRASHLPVGKYHCSIAFSVGLKLASLFIFAGRSSLGPLSGFSQCINHF